MRETVETIELVSQHGQKVRARRTTVYETGRLIGGGEMPTSTRTELPDGTYIEELMNGQFIDKSTGTFYKPA